MDSPPPSTSVSLRQFIWGYRLAALDDSTVRQLHTLTSVNAPSLHGWHASQYTFQADPAGLDSLQRALDDAMDLDGRAVNNPVGKYQLLGNGGIYQTDPIQYETDVDQDMEYTLNNLSYRIMETYGKPEHKGRWRRPQASHSGSGIMDFSWSTGGSGIETKVRGALTSLLRPRSGAIGRNEAGVRLPEYIYESSQTAELDGTGQVRRPLCLNLVNRRTGSIKTSLSNAVRGPMANLSDVESRTCSLLTQIVNTLEANPDVVDLLVHDRYQYLHLSRDVTATDRIMVSPPISNDEGILDLPSVLPDARVFSDAKLTHKPLGLMLGMIVRGREKSDEAKKKRRDVKVAQAAERVEQAERVRAKRQKKMTADPESSANSASPRRSSRLTDKGGGVVGGGDPRAGGGAGAGAGGGAAHAHALDGGQHLTKRPEHGGDRDDHHPAKEGRRHVSDSSNDSHETELRTPKDDGMPNADMHMHVDKDKDKNTPIVYRIHLDIPKNSAPTRSIDSTTSTHNHSSNGRVSSGELIGPYATLCASHGQDGQQANQSLELASLPQNSGLASTQGFDQPTIRDSRSKLAAAARVVRTRTEMPRKWKGDFNDDEDFNDDDGDERSDDDNDDDDGGDGDGGERRFMKESLRTAHLGPMRMSRRPKIVSIGLRLGRLLAYGHLWDVFTARADETSGEGSTSTSGEESQDSPCSSKGREVDRQNDDGIGNGNGDGNGIGIDTRIGSTTGHIALGLPSTGYTKPAPSHLTTSDDVDDLDHTIPVKLPLTNSLVGPPCGRSRNLRPEDLVLKLCAPSYFLPSASYPGYSFELKFEQAVEAILHEDQILTTELARLQGRIVPVYHGLYVGWLPLENTAFPAKKDIRMMVCQKVGRELTLDEAKGRYRDRILFAYAQLHEAMIVHNDVELRHIRHSRDRCDRNGHPHTPFTWSGDSLPKTRAQAEVMVNGTSDSGLGRTLGPGSEPHHDQDDGIFLIDFDNAIRLKGLPHEDIDDLKKEEMESVLRLVS